MTKKKMHKDEIQYKIEEGWIHGKVLFQLIGNPKEHVEETLKAYMENISLMDNVLLIDEHYEAPEALENEEGKKSGLWSTYCDAEVLVRDMTVFTLFCINYMPANIEILAPKKLGITEKTATDFLNDLLAKLHEVSTVAKQIRVQNEHIVKGFNAIAQNFITHLLSQEINDLPTLQKKTGMDEASLKQFLAALKKQGKITMDVDKKELGKAVKKAKKKKKK